MQEHAKERREPVRSTDNFSMKRKKHLLVFAFCWLKSAQYHYLFTVRRFRQNGVGYGVE
jgi:hypothetical protein